MGRTTISFTSTSLGCSTANAIARAMADAGIAIVRYSTMRVLRSGSEIVSASSDPTALGEMVVTRSLSPASWRSPSEMARTANLVPD